MLKRILIAEDEPITRDTLTSNATRQGYEVVAVTNGVDLLSLASEEKFDLVITDLKMPDLNGAAATEILKLQGSATPVIALTGLSSGDVILVEDKFAKIFHKPIDIGKLFEFVGTLLR